MIEAVDTAAFERDLRAAVRGEVHFEDAYRAMYSTDASNYRQVPIAVVLPLDEGDMIAAVNVAHDHGAPIVHRGGGTSLAGETCNDAIVIDSSKYLNNLLSVDYEARTARVQPGLVLDDLRNTAEKHGFTYGCAPSTHNRCTLGGMIGNNSCGMPAQKWGKTDQNLETLDILTYDGLRMTVGPTSPDEFKAIVAGGGRRAEIYQALKTLADEYGDRIRERFPDIPRRVSGFALDQLLPENGFNVARALVGTEGTCVTVLGAVVKLVPDPPYKALALVGFDDIATVGDHCAYAGSFGPIALEGMDSTLFQLMYQKGKNPHKQRDLFPEGDAWIVAQFGGETPEEAEAAADKMCAAIRARTDTVRGSRVTSDKHIMQEIFETREAGLGVTSKVPNESDFYPGWEDSAVDPERLGDYLRVFQKKLEEYGYQASIYGHFGQACVHCSINFDLFTAEGIAKYRKFVTEMAHVCVQFGGSLSGEHGDGQARGELLPIMYGDDLVDAFWKFKTIWDPQNKMNPGKVVHPHRLDENLRWGTQYEPREPETFFSFIEDRGSFAYAANRCVGAGVCRKHDKGTMCPSYMASKEEKYSTRGRARLLFEMLRGRPVEGGWKNEEVRESLDFCLACKACKHECPVNVDMATYKSEFLHHYYEGRMRPLHMWLFGYLFRWAKIAALAPDVANFFSQAPPFSTVLKRLAKIAPQRRIPMFAAQTFRQWFSRRAKRKGEAGRVLLWVDTWNEHFHPQTARAAVEVLEDAGYEVIIPPRQVCCGRPLYDYGLLAPAKRHLETIVADLRDAIRDGVPVVGLEPSCISVFKDEMQSLLNGDIDARRLAQQTYMLDTFLNDVATKREGYSVPKLMHKAVVHEHCHKKSVLDPTAESHAFDRMKLDAQFPDTGCCGMAGAFGFEAEHYSMSTACAERKLLPAVREASPQTIIVADGFSCREQIQQLSDRKALHPAEVLKLAVDRRGIDREEAYPESLFFPDEEARRRNIISRGYLAIAAAGAVLAGALIARRWMR
ncbi:MAG TPA: FAD-linked oxidase C-terminal domain-containing protein [Candidatus Baltobacteraceae bacterium]|nr:FAD-linked oxidase C-terminal domain-containing protein [Candidatus Baltobacteraceae bacterium]